METPYIVKLPTSAAHRRYVTAGRLKAMFEPKYRVKGKIGPFRERERNGTDHKQLRIFVQDVKQSRGNPWNQSEIITTDRSAAGVKAVVRRVRPEEMERIAIIDAELEEIKAQLAAKRYEREELIREAWGKAHVVRLAEIEALLESEEST